MTIAVLGGTGFIGPAVAARLLARGLEPLVIARGKHPVTLPAGAKFEPVDRMDAPRLLDLCRTAKVDTLIDIFALGVANSAPVLEVMGTIGGRYVPLSSVDVYANYGGLLRRESPPIQLTPAREDDPLRGFRYPYRANSHRPRGVENAMLDDYDKIPLEEAALADTRFETTVIRAPMVFGPGDKQHRFRWAIGAAGAGGRIEIDERAAGWPNSYGYIDDIAEAMVVAATSPVAAGRIYNVGQGFVRTSVEWLHTFAAVLGTSIEVVAVPPEQKALLHERADATDLRYPLTLDTSRIRAELGFTEPTAERDALLATIAAERSTQTT